MHPKLESIKKIEALKENKPRFSTRGEKKRPKEKRKAFQAPQNSQSAESVAHRPPTGN